MKWYKLWGNPYSSFMAVEFNIFRWLIGFNCVRFKYKPARADYFNISIGVGPVKITVQIGR
jgi:hypothetical protein